MYGVPEKNRLDGIIGKELIQISFGSHQVIFQFEECIRISVESSITYSILDEQVRHYDEFWKQETSLTKFLGAAVIGLEVKGAKKLILTFSNVGTIELIDSSDQYESFQIEIGGEMIVV